MSVLPVAALSRLDVLGKGMLRVNMTCTVAALPLGGGSDGQRVPCEVHCQISQVLGQRTGSPFCRLDACSDVWMCAG